MTTDADLGDVPAERLRLYVDASRVRSARQRLADGIKAGAVFVNMPSIPDAAAPWGGYKQSGWGREMGPQAIDVYTQTKAVWLHHGY